MEKRRKGREVSSCDEFFKVYLPNQSSQRLRVPPAFVKHFNGIIPNKIMLNDLGGYFWHVEMEETENGVFFMNGWQRFACDHSLELGSFLVFRYDRSCSFDVKIFGNNGCMKEAPLAYKCINEETPPVEKTTISVKIKEESKKKSKKESEEESQKESQEEYKEEYTCPKPTRYSKRKYSEVNMKRSEISKGSHAESRCRSQRIGSKTVEQSRTFDAPDFSRPKNPYFVASLRPSSRSHLNIPKNFLVKHGIKMEPEMVLRDQQGKLWPVKVCIMTDGRTTFTKGWAVFHKDNSLGLVDKCRFEFSVLEGRTLSREIKVQIPKKLVTCPTRKQLPFLGHKLHRYPTRR